MTEHIVSDYLSSTRLEYWPPGAYIFTVHYVCMLVLLSVLRNTKQYKFCLNYFRLRRFLMVISKPGGHKVTCYADYQLSSLTCVQCSVLKRTWIEETKNCLSGILENELIRPGDGRFQKTWAFCFCLRPSSLASKNERLLDTPWINKQNGKDS